MSRRRLHVERLAVDQLHHQERFGHLQQQRLADLQLEAAAQVGVGELPGDLELRLHLLDEADVLLARRARRA